MAEPIEQTVPDTDDVDSQSIQNELDAMGQGDPEKDGE